jgi:hypothetical protein
MHLGPGDKKPEDLADEIINGSDGDVDGLLEGTEVDYDDQFDDDEDADEPPDSDY